MEKCGNSALFPISIRCPCINDSAYLYDGIHETCVSQVGKPTNTRLSPFSGPGRLAIIAKVIVSGTARSSGGGRGTRARRGLSFLYGTRARGRHCGWGWNFVTIAEK